MRGNASQGEPNAFARDLFTGIAGSYDFWAQALSFGQYLNWRRSLVSRLTPGAAPLVLDISTGRAGVAIEIARRGHGEVVGLDLTRPMLLAGQTAVAKAGLEGRIRLVQGRAESLPIPDETFDAVFFTFLLRYVPDPEATLREMARVLKPGGRMFSLEFGVPPNPLWRALWSFYTRAVMPAVTLPVSPGWRHVGSFLGPSISGFYKRYPLDRQKAMWSRCGLAPVNAFYLSLGGALIMCAEKERQGKH